MSNPFETPTKSKYDDNALPQHHRADSDPTITHSEHPYSHESSSGDRFPMHAEHGPPIDNYNNQIRLEEDYALHNRLWWSRVRHYIRDPAAEFFGTFIMIIFGDGSVAQVTLSQAANLPKSSQNKGDYQSISWG